MRELDHVNEFLGVIVDRAPGASPELLDDVNEFFWFVAVSLREFDQVFGAGEDRAPFAAALEPAYTIYPRA